MVFADEVVGYPLCRSLSGLVEVVEDEKLWRSDGRRVDLLDCRPIGGLFGRTFPASVILWHAPIVPAWARRNKGPCAPLQLTLRLCAAAEDADAAAPSGSGRPTDAGERRRLGLEGGGQRRDDSSQTVDDVLGIDNRRTTSALAAKSIGEQPGDLVRGKPSRDDCPRIIPRPSFFPPPSPGLISPEPLRWSESRTHRRARVPLAMR